MKRITCLLLVLGAVGCVGLFFGLCGGDSASRRDRGELPGELHI